MTSLDPEGDPNQRVFKSVTTKERQGTRDGRVGEGGGGRRRVEEGGGARRQK